MGFLNHRLDTFTLIGRLIISLPLGELSDISNEAGDDDGGLHASAILLSYSNDCNFLKQVFTFHVEPRQPATAYFLNNHHCPHILQLGHPEGIGAK